MSTDEPSVGMVLFVAFLIAVALGGFCVDYVVFTCWGKDLPTWADCCIGAVTSGIAVTAAIVCVIVKACDIETPFFNQPVVVQTPAVTQPAR